MTEKMILAIKKTVLNVKNFLNSGKQSKTIQTQARPREKPVIKLLMLLQKYLIRLSKAIVQKFSKKSAKLEFGKNENFAIKDSEQFPIEITS